MREVTRELARNDVTMFRIWELCIDIARRQSRADARVADGAKHRAVSAVNLLPVATEAGVMVRVTPGDIWAGGSGDSIGLCV